MELAAILLFTSVLALSTPPAPAQSGELILRIGNNYNYSTFTNYSDIQLVCIIEDLQSNNWCLPDGPDFQLNGIDIEKEINVTYNDIDDCIFANFYLTPEKEGFFTCSYNGSLSYNSIGLAG